MQEKNNNAVIILGIVGLLGCGGVVVLLGAFFLFGAVSARTSPISPIPPSVPAAPVASPAITAPPGWGVHRHVGPCPTNPNLRLPEFQVIYPSGHEVLPCQRQEPVPWAYVTFHAEAPDGRSLSQWTLGYAVAPTHGQLAEVADNLVRQLNATAPSTQVDVAPLMARGGALMRRDSTFVVGAPVGGFVPGTYIYRQVVVPNPTRRDGVLVTFMKPVVDVATELAANDADLTRVVESVTF